MTRFRDALTTCLALGAVTLPAIASDGPVTVIGRPAPGLVAPMHRPAPPDRLIQISTMHRHVVGLMVQEDVVAPEVIQLQMGNQPIFVDPDRNYGRDTGGIDDGHSIMRAQRAYKAMTGRGAHVIRRGNVADDADQMDRIMPRAILLRPDFMERRVPQRPAEPVPAPAAPKVKPGPVASAE